MRLCYTPIDTFFILRFVAGVLLRGSGGAKLVFLPFNTLRVEI
jgi:hypothetical protein